MKRFDLFGHRLHLLFAGKDTFKTGLGGTVTVLLYLVVFLFGQHKCMELVTKNEPALTTTQKNIPTTAPLNLAENHFDFMLWISQDNKEYKQESVKVP